MKKNTLHTDPIHLPRDPTVLPTEITGTKENNESENIYKRRSICEVGAFFHSLGLAFTNFLLHTKTAAS